MSIQIGDRIPSVKLKHLTAEGMEEVSTDDLFAGKKVVMFGLPGAYTPTCSAKHMPGFIDKLDALKDKGVDAVLCLSVNDPFVMKAWGEDQGASGKVDLLPDGNAELTKAMGLDFDGSGAGLGTRSKRFAMVVEDGVVKHVAVEDAPGGMEVSSAEKVLEAL
ncbi:MAG: peroxiredoxin [Rhodovibrionaceae bacterium]|nr:peroxiredoxin [Rhodovibrionaceae bacterium]